MASTGVQSNSSESASQEIPEFGIQPADSDAAVTEDSLTSPQDKLKRFLSNSSSITYGII